MSNENRISTHVFLLILTGILLFDYMCVCFIENFFHLPFSFYIAHRALYNKLNFLFYLFGSFFCLFVFFSLFDYICLFCSSLTLYIFLFYLTRKHKNFYLFFFSYQTRCEIKIFKTFTMALCITNIWVDFVLFSFLVCLSIYLHFLWFAEKKITLDIFCVSIFKLFFLSCQFMLIGKGWVKDNR